MQFFFKKHASGFSFVEMMTALGIAGVVGVTGLNSYRKSRHQARAAQAQYTLSNIYTAEKNFKSQWNTYHENLYIIGAIPEGEIYYDAGFKVAAADISNSDGRLGKFPWKDLLKTPKCATFYEICQGDCATEINTTVPSADRHSTGASYYGGGTSGFSCNVTGGKYVKDSTGTTYKANASSFTALARAGLHSLDEWTIDQGQVVKHITDGTGN